MRFLPSVLLAAAVVTACGPVRQVEPVPVPPARPEAPPPPPVEEPTPPPPPAPATPGRESQDLAKYYERIERGLLAKGLLRKDGGGPDTPWDADRLAETFLRLAFYEEYAPNSGVLVQRETESRLHRWGDPVRIETRFGATIPEDQRTEDRIKVITFARQLARATGHPITTIDKGGNFIVFVVNEEDRQNLGSELRRFAPELENAALASVLDLPRTTYCVVFAVDAGQTGRYTRAVAIIRGEHPDLLRLSCIHEEVAQGLGLANDSPRARPSIFNDDEEFALLTKMDEQLLAILYDKRLSPGMTREEAEPIVRLIAAELIPGES